MDLKEINLNVDEGERLDEVRARALGDAVKLALWDMFGYHSTPSIQVKGTAEQISAFMTALAGEKRYMESFMDNGLDDPQTYKDKIQLDHAIRNFEIETGMKWPIE